MVAHLLWEQGEPFKSDILDHKGLRASYPQECGAGQTACLIIKSEANP